MSKTTVCYNEYFVPPLAKKWGGSKKICPPLLKSWHRPCIKTLKVTFYCYTIKVQFQEIWIHLALQFFNRKQHSRITSKRCVIKDAWFCSGNGHNGVDAV